MREAGLPVRRESVTWLSNEITTYITLVVRS